MRLITKKEFDEKVSLGLMPPESGKKVVRDLVNWLIMSLYEPDPELVYKAEKKKVESVGAWNELVNWGDLQCVCVEEHGNCYVAIIEEARDCPNLIAWLEGWLRKWGWNIVIKAEW